MSGNLRISFKKGIKMTLSLHILLFTTVFVLGSVLKSKNDNPKQKFKVKGIITLLHFARKSDILVRVIKME